ncbi:hypothetical protein Nmel_008641, partial [Mimus melanotis]
QWGKPQYLSGGTQVYWSSGLPIEVIGDLGTPVLPIQSNRTHQLPL